MRKVSFNNFNLRLLGIKVLWSLVWLSSIVYYEFPLGFAETSQTSKPRIISWAFQIPKLLSNALLTNEASTKQQRRWHTFIVKVLKKNKIDLYVHYPFWLRHQKYFMKVLYILILDGVAPLSTYTSWNVFSKKKTQFMLKDGNWRSSNDARYSKHLYR